VQIVTEAPKAKVTYRQFEEFLVAEKGQTESCATLPFTIVFWITFSILAWLHGDVHNVYETRRCLSSVVEDIRIVAGAGTPQARNVSLGRLTSREDIWEWTSLGLVPALGGLSPDGSTTGFVRSYNMLIGSVRLIQWRSATEDCKVLEDLKNFYGNTKCHSDEVSTDNFGGNLEDLAFKAGSALTNANQNAFYAWMDPRHVKVSQARCAELSARRWLDDSSHYLILEATFFNAEAKTFALLKITFEFRKGGLIRQEVDLRPLSANLYPHWYYYLPDVLWVLWLFLLFQKESRQVYDSCRQGPEEREEYFGDPWNFLDWSSIIIGFCLALFFWLLTDGIDQFKLSVGDLTDLNKPVNGTSIAQDQLLMITSPTTYKDSLVYNEAVTDILDRMNTLVLFKIYHRIGMFWYTVILMARFFKGFRGQPRIALISKTLALASVDLVHYYIILATVFVNFSLGGYVLFGAQTYAWSTLHNAANSAFAMTFGKVDYESLHQVAPVSAAIWFWSYIVIVVFILFNMCISIIVGHYGEVRSSFGEVGQSVWVQARWLAGDTYWHYSYEFRRLHRLAVSKMKPKWRRRLSRFPEEVERNPLPMNAMFRAVSPNAGEYIRKSMPTLKFDRNMSGGEQSMKEVTVDLLLSCGCDSVTAEHLLMRSRRYQGAKVDLFNPMDSLLKQLDDNMMERYQHLAELEEKILYYTDGQLEGLEMINETSQRCYQALKTITPAEEEPPGVPIPGSIWREIRDGNTVYYYNPQTGESQWDNPMGIKKQGTANKLLMPPSQNTLGAAIASAAFQVLTKKNTGSLEEEEAQSTSPAAAAADPVQNSSAADGAGVGL